jgi:hypothetical protein
MKKTGSYLLRLVTVGVAFVLVVSGETLEALGIAAVLALLLKLEDRR